MSEAYGLVKARNSMLANGVVKYSESHPRKASIVIAQTEAGRVDILQSLSVKSGMSDDFTIMRISREAVGHGVTDLQDRMEAYTACVHLRRFDGYDIWCDDRREQSAVLPEGSIHISDMRCVWSADIRGPFDVVNFCVPQSALDEMTEEFGLSPVEQFCCPIGLARVDVVLKNLALALLPALAKPSETNKLFADHAVRAVTAHMIRNYGSLKRLPRFARGSLAYWQERRAKDMLRANLCGDLSISELAGACGLSSSHFSQAFKKTVGCPPHRWLLIQRVEKAKRLLLNSRQQLSEIALETGFTDQSHFTRVFSQHTGESPGAWRRAQIR
jgi:AraC family transcriptional regulator